MPFLNEVGQRSVVGANKNELVFLSYDKDPANCHIVQKQYLAFMKALNPLIGIVKDEDVPIGADALQDAMCGRFIDPDRVAR